MEQRTEEWYLARLGRVTASRIADVVARTRSGWGASRANYMAELIAERLTGQPAASYTNAAMQWGIEHEDDAIAAYEFEKGVEVERVGFILHPRIEMSGASPDGRVGYAGLIEIKCPNTATHIETLLTRAIPDKYIKQMQWQMACDNRQWCDFVSYDPRLPGDLAIFICRVARDDNLIKPLESDVTDFLQEMDTKLELLQKLRIADKVA